MSWTGFLQRLRSMSADPSASLQVCEYSLGRPLLDLGPDPGSQSLPTARRVEQFPIEWGATTGKTAPPRRSGLDYRPARCRSDTLSRPNGPSRGYSVRSNSGPDSEP